MAISKVAIHHLLCCVLTLYVHISKFCFTNVKSKHEERLISDRLFVRVFLRRLNFQNPDNPYCTISVSSFIMNISFNHSCVCRVELSNPSCLAVVCKRGSVELTETVRQRGLASSLPHTQGDRKRFLHICFI